MDSFVLMDYDFGYPLSKRESFIAREREKKITKTLAVHYKNKTIELPVITVPINLPIYRIENIRTKSLQIEYLVQHPEKDKNFFKVDTGSMEVQEIQHDLLYKLSKSTNLLKEFKKHPNLDQTEPLISTPDGVIVNGNRRLAVWRELLHNEGKVYERFANIQLAILPDNNPQDIYKLELSLQVSPDLKDDYKWHAIAADYTEKFNLGLDTNFIAKLSDKKSDEVNLSIECYQAAIEYLELIGHPQEWSRVDKDEFAFKEIVKAKKELSDPTDKLIFSQLTKAFLSAEKTEDRLYKLIPQIGKYLSQIKNKLKDVFDVQDKENENDDDPLSQFTDDKTDDIDIQICTYLSDEKDPQVIVNTVSNVIKTCNELEKEKKDSSFILKQVQKAAGALNDALEQMKEGMSKQGVSEQLDKITDYTNLIRKWIEQ